MENIQIEVRDNLLTITVDLTQRGRLSKAGRSRVIGCTNGNVPLIDSKGYRKERLNCTVSVPLSQEELAAWPLNDTEATAGPT